MEIGKQIICDKCRKSVHLSDIKYMLKGLETKIAVCSNCREKKVEPVKDSVSKPAIDKRPQYSCTFCKYRFKFDTSGVTNLRCPYCGQSKWVEKVKSFF